MAQRTAPLALLTLARDNNVEGIKSAVAAGLPVDICNAMGQTAAHVAALWGNVEALEALLKLGMNPNLENARGQTPLHFAASSKKNTRKVCEVLLQYGAAKDIMDMGSRVPYECAEDDEVRQLLGGPDSKLFIFSEEGKHEQLEQLLAGGSVKSVRVVDAHGRTPLNLAVMSESLPTVQAVLKHDAGCLDLPDAGGDTAVHIAAEVGNLEVLNYLLSLRPNVNAQNRNASEYASGSWVLHGETIEPLDLTPLHVAVENSDVPVARALLEAGADPNVLDFGKRSAFHAAVEDGVWELVELMLEHGANVNLHNADFTSVLHFLSQRGPSHMLQAMVARGGDAKLANSDGWTPLHLAARAGAAEKCTLLAAAGSPVNAVNSQGNAALHLAALNGHLEAVKALLAAGADRQQPNSKDGRLAADMAKTEEIKSALQAAS